MSTSKEIHIRPSSSVTNLNLRELLDYRDLILLLIRRDFVARYKQTILGPAWAVIQPVATALVFTVVFGKVAKIPTDGAPPFLFYLSGMLLWQLFSGTVQSGGNSLQTNAPLFTKVYFPRIIPSLANGISQLIPFVIQMLIFFGFFAWYLLRSETAELHPMRLLWLPPMILLTMFLSLGVCLGYSALTAKYRDLTHALGFIVQLGFYVTPVIFPVSAVSEKWQWLVWLNPMAAPVTTVKWIFLDAGQFPLWPLVASAAFSVVLAIITLAIFQRVQRTFVDTV